MEYAHERANEPVCAECGAKRKDRCVTEEGKPRVAHDSRVRFETLERDHEHYENKAYDVRMSLDALRRLARERAEESLKRSVDGR